MIQTVPYDATNLYEGSIFACEEAKVFHKTR